MSLNFGIPKNKNFPFGTNEKFNIYRRPNIQVHYSSADLGLTNEQSDHGLHCPFFKQHLWMHYLTKSTLRLAQL